MRSHVNEIINDFNIIKCDNECGIKRDNNYRHL